jgi:formylglycine-generating enzyme required for sulfatase activity
MRWVASFLLVLFLLICSALQPVGLEWVLAGTWAESGKDHSDKVTAPTDVIEVSLPGLPDGAYPMRLVRIPAGTFQMGSPATERGRSPYEGPLHTVTITDDYYIGETEVTQGQWQAVMGSNPAFGHGIGPDYPVYNVNWYDVTQTNGFLKRLDAQSSYNGFRLPTEAEWEYACRAGTSTRFSFGDNLSCDDECGSCNLADQYMWWCGNNAPDENKPVHSKLPNAFGLYDMHGSVKEWCQDWYQYNFYSQPGATRPNPLCTNGNSFMRVLRGGDWDWNAKYCRSANRSSLDPHGKGGMEGFRVVLDLETSSVENWDMCR